MEKRNRAKETELRLVAELMKNSRRSDRELGKVLKLSQPTVSRTRERLEKEGIVKEYTAIPDFRKLGFSILAITLTRLNRVYPSEIIQKKAEERLAQVEKDPIPDILHVYGLGLNAERVLITLHTDYTSYKKFIERLKTNSLLEIDTIRSFLVDLTDEQSHFRSLTLSQVANFLLKNLNNFSKPE